MAVPPESYGPQVGNIPTSTPGYRQQAGNLPAGAPGYGPEATSRAPTSESGQYGLRKM